MTPTALFRRVLGLSAAALVIPSLALLGTASSGAVVQPTGDATATVETTPVTHSGDAADDMAIWRNPADPALSLVIGNDKGGALDVYDLDGSRRQQFAEGFFGNVDVRSGFRVGTGLVDIAAASRRGIRIYGIDPVTRTLSNITDTSTGSITSPIGGEGLCLYRSPVNAAVYVFTDNRSGQVAQIRLTDNDGDGLVEGTTVRQWDVGGETEGCVADDDLGDFYISEEDVGVWKYGAEPSDPTTTASRTSVDQTIALGGRIRPDAEGLTIVHQPGGTGYLIVSAQAASNTLNSFLVYTREGSNAFVREFRVVTGTIADGCGMTDGIDSLAADLGPAFPRGVFICQDNDNTAPGVSGNQNFKLVPLERVVGLAPTTPQPPTADIAVTCTDLTCRFDGTGSTDPDGTVSEYQWTFGDGATGSGATTSHVYSAAGTYVASLTVTDDTGLTGTAARSVTVPAAATPISFVGQATSDANALVHRVTVPAAVRAGDGLLLFLGINTTATIGTPTGVTGWQTLGTVLMNGATTRVWRKVASAGDAGAQVSVSVSAYSKANAVLLAYRGTTPGDPVASFQGVADAANRTSHTTPRIGTAAGQWAISYWTHKDTLSTSLTPPPGIVVRASGTQSGSGTVKGLVGDSGGPVGTTSYGGLVTTAPSGGSAASAWTIALAPAH